VQRVQRRSRRGERVNAALDSCSCVHRCGESAAPDRETLHPHRTGQRDGEGLPDGAGGFDRGGPDGVGGVLNGGAAGVDDVEQAVAVQTGEFLIAMASDWSPFSPVKAASRGSRAVDDA